MAGMAKNVGKTVTLNHILREGSLAGKKFGVTSIGVDGETKDMVTGTGKPEIYLYRNTVFATSEVFYHRRQIQSEILAVSNRQTSLGRIVTSRALCGGKAILAGPPDTATMRELIMEMQGEGAETVLIDGALSRVSPASPDITEALILSTGAALSPEISKIVAQTSFIWQLTELPEVKKEKAAILNSLQSGVWGINRDGEIHDFEIKSGLQSNFLHSLGFKEKTESLYIGGIVTDRMLKELSGKKEFDGVKLIVRDFTKLFIAPSTFRIFKAKGGTIEVVKRSRLLAITVNPWSPAGFTLDRERLTDALREKIAAPVICLRPHDS